MMKIRFSACAETLLQRTAANVRAATMKRMNFSLVDGAPPRTLIRDCGKEVNGALTVQVSSEAFTGLSSAMS
jgi:hypothetical protein